MSVSERLERFNVETIELVVTEDVEEAEVEGVFAMFVEEATAEDAVALLLAAAEEAKADEDEVAAVLLEGDAEAVGVGGSSVMSIMTGPSS